MRMTAVIGANFGDEGKGLMTDYFSNPKTTVVRFNGGAQAGHTVVTPDGKRHVFHHFGSGTLAGASTLLDRNFIINPIVFRKEFEELGNPKVFAMPECIITTPYDMMINEIVEKHRGRNKHGSCGYGINETVVRNGLSRFKTNLGMTLGSIGLDMIAESYVPWRLNQSGIEIPEKYESLLKDVNIREKFLDDLRFVHNHVDIDYPMSHTVPPYEEELVFEGAQGLCLDMDYKFFPHVTRSHTGMNNVELFLQAMDIPDPIEVVYVTRCYLTRHGAGPFPTEQELPFDVKDETNIPNQFQDSLRFGLLDVDELAANIEADFCDRHKLSLAVTCLDQCGDSVPFILDGKKTTMLRPTFLEVLKIVTGAENIYGSYGPTRKDIVIT
jgi:adenylosuccinate synthase